jgi:hypothetical protein
LSILMNGLCLPSIVCHRANTSGGVTSTLDGLRRRCAQRVPASQDAPPVHGSDIGAPPGAARSHPVRSILHDHLLVALVWQPASSLNPPAVVSGTGGEGSRPLSSNCQCSQVERGARAPTMEPQPIWDLA